MGCTCSKSVSSNEPNESGQQLLRTLKDIQADLDRFHQLANEENAAASDRKCLLDSNSVIKPYVKPCIPYDLCDALLTSFFSCHSSNLPGERFALDGWLKILTKTGLQNMRDADIVFQCARRIEFFGAECMKHATDDEEIWSLAETLIKAIFENVSLLHSHSFCSVFGKIACIPAEKNFPSKSGKKLVKRVFCSYSDVVLLKDWPLAWTAAPVLSNKSLVPPDYSWGALQLRSPPPFTIVLKHLQAETEHTGSSLFTIETASFEVLKYLDKIWGTLSSSDILELQQLAFIAVANGTCLATPGSLFACLSINVSPFAFELPSQYLPFLKVLKELGVKDTLSISCAMHILTNLHKSCGYYPLNPKELHTVIELLQFLCDETQTSDRPSWASELVVPDDECRLVRPNTCVYIDPHGSQYVNFIDCSKLRFVHHDVSERLCLAFGIAKLSNVFVEELDCFEDLEEAEPVSLAAIRQKLLSRSFQAAVSSVVNNFSSNITSGFKNPDLMALQRSLEYIAERLQFVHSIYTRFSLLPKYVDVTRSSNGCFIPEFKSGSSHRAVYYVDRSNTCMLIVERPNYVSVVDLVAIVVSRVLGSPVPLPIGSLFLCPQYSEPALVNFLNVSCDERVLERIGSHLHPRDEKKLLFDDRPSFVKGDVVAWQSQVGEELKYGRICEDVRLTRAIGKASARIKVEPFPRVTEDFTLGVSRFQVFTIKKDSSTDGMPAESDKLLISMQVQQ